MSELIIVRKEILNDLTKMIPIEETVGSEILVLIVIFDSMCHCQHSHSL